MNTLETDNRDKVGDVFTHTDGKRYKVTKRTKTAIAVTRYYFWDAGYDWIVRKLAKGSEVHPE